MCEQATGDSQTTNSLKADPEKLPDLTRLFKNRARDSDVIKKCKHMLIAGYSPARVALLLRLQLEKVLIIRTIPAAVVLPTATPTRIQN